MSSRIPEKLAILSVQCTHAARLERPREMRVGDRFNLVINDEYFPCSIDAVEGDVLKVGETKVVTLRAIMSPSFVALPENQYMELREGPQVFASCNLRLVVSVS